MSCPMLAACATFLCTAMSLAQTPAESVTILLQYDHPGSAASQESMQEEVQSLLGNNFAIRFGAVTDPFGSTSGRLVVFTMRGYCSMDHVASNEPRGLALGSAVVSEGAVLPFGRVECDRIRASIQGYSRAGSEQAQRQLGQAMGRVVVHELYHMLSGSMSHSRHGLTKGRLSSLELTASTAKLPRESAEAMEFTPVSERVETNGIGTISTEETRK